MQADDDGMLHAVRYGSYATTPAKANYSAEDLEAVGLMYALKSIEWLVQCHHVTVITDNTAVLHIQDWNPRNRRQRRMPTYIMQFNMTICDIRGRRIRYPIRCHGCSRILARNAGKMNPNTCMKWMISFCQ